MKFIKKWIKEKEEIVNKIHKLNEYLSSKEVKEAFDEFEINKMLYKLSMMQDYSNVLDDLIIYRKNNINKDKVEQLKLF
jgi:hypothetical protein